MPELPDLQVFSRNLEKKLKGKKVEKLEILNHKSIKETAAVFNKAVAGEDVKKVYREGKELRFVFSNHSILGVHLMLHGKFVLINKTNAEKNAVAILHFDDDTALAITDFQGLARVYLNPEEKASPDALSVTAEYLKQTLLATRKSIKDVLMDQDKIRGIGNAYADEILWDCLISPFSVSNKIPSEKITALTKSIKKVLSKAEENILKHHPDIIAGEIRDFLLIHNPNNKTSPGGATIRIHTKSRKTYYTDEQELYK